ncbi:U3 small nucleolar RNA-associated protein 25 [Trypanosoma conorhini]|uniref:U3 small nucleolar RNA-associated protein 25 n=1 Tax=Trypanosoma conorhini TaxID=83891 RepID=A0A422PBB2_9TRYP|nr:U3 small nucleolar RNA-associated protein 25 [Trypanosoma conorhini]RNF15002.1 U3 small nucleolar RNA-associated protein 25 [Trypanosoma conorhini]
MSDGEAEEEEEEEEEEGDYEEEEEEEEEGDYEEEEEEDADVGKEDEYEDDDSVVAAGDDEAAAAGEQQRMEEAGQLLPQFRPGTTGLAALQDVVTPNDPWFVKYHQDKHGGIDTSPMRPQAGGGANIAVAASAHAVRHLLHAPFVLGKSHPQRPPYMHETLWAKWLDYCAAESRGPMTAEERGLLDLLQGYPDVMDCCRSWENADARCEIFLLHAVNHWFKARSVVLAHDALLQERRRERKRRQKKRRMTDAGKKRGEAAEEEEEEDEDEEAYEFRDRGFGRTRIIILLPMRNIAHRYMTTLVKLLRASPGECGKLAMFNEDFTELAEAADPTFKRRPRDYQRQFAGNIDDAFCVGVRLEPSRVRVYTHPLNSDVILCSPLGLRRRLERSGDVLVSLASIEVCLLDEAHVLLMQNWQHVEEVLRLLNKRPKDTTHGLSDLRRVYAWALAGQSGRHRQTIMCTDLTNATLLATFRRGVNNSGRVLLQRREEAGVLAQVMVPVRQHFLRFDAGADPKTCDDARFDFFTREVYATKISPLVERDVRTIVFVPSYFDFVRLRNYLIREHRDSFAAICEYTSLPRQRKALGQFTDLERPLLLVTERFYFFKRYFVKLAEVMVFYSPPLFPAFYVSLVGRLVAASPNAFALTLFCRFDTHELHRLVGTRRTRQLLEREADAFSFVTN